MIDFFFKANPSYQFKISDNSGEIYSLKLLNYSSNQFVCEKIENSNSTFQFELHLPSLEIPISGIVDLNPKKVCKKTSYFKIKSLTGGEKEWLQYNEQRLKSLKAEDIMQSSPMTAHPETKITDVIQKMKTINAGSILITNAENQLQGIFTERDVMNRCLENDFFNRPVSDFMSTQLSVIETDACGEEVYLKFRNAHFRHLPVTHKGKLAGIISIRDLVRYWSKLLEIQKQNITKKYEKTMSIIVHDLRSPIYAIRAINEVLLQKISTPQEYTEQGFPTLINDSCNTMISLIDDLLKASEDKYSNPKLKREPVALDEISKDLITTFLPSAQKKNIEIKTQFDQDLPQLQLDPTKVTQIMQNLISNAIKYSDKDSSVEITIQHCDQQNGVIFSVTDHGQGIKPNEINKVFDELCKISSKPTANEPSTGLGLSIAKRLVEAHGGTISVSSEPHKETKFSVFFPDYSQPQALAS